MEIKRDIYLQKIINRMHNGMIKVITGIRRSGKSYLLFIILKKYLKSEGVPEDHIIAIELDRLENKKYRYLCSRKYIGTPLKYYCKGCHQTMA